MPTDKSKRYFRWLGSALSILAVIFVVSKLREYGNEIDIHLFISLALPAMCLSVFYGLASILLALAWKDLLENFKQSVSSRLAISIYGESQLAKYVPGNVFQFFGRQALGLEAGLAAWPIAKSALWEIGLLVVAGSTFFAVVLPVYYKGLPVMSAVVLFALVVLSITGIFYRWYGLLVARVMIWYVAFLVLTGLVFLTLLLLIAPANSIDGTTSVFICGSYIVAWLAGFVTPGAPAGIGIREVLLFALISPFTSEADLLAAIILGRIVTVGGDILYFLFALILNTRTVNAA